MRDSELASETTINNHLFEKIEKYLKNDAVLLNELDAAIALTEAEPLRIAACGLLKAGKSSLLNALTGHLDPDAALFPTGAVRTTVKNQEFSKQNFCFIDTPGLDATDEDDIEAWEGIKSSDILLFIHHSETGELQLPEVDFLKSAACSEYGSSLKDRLIVVLTHCEAHTEEEEVKAIGDSIGRQIKNIIGYEVPQFHTSFTSYRKGILSDKPQLAEWSKIPELMKYLFSNKADKYNAVIASRQEKVLAIRKKLINTLEAEISKREERLACIQNHEKNKRNEFKKDAKTFVNALRKKINSYDKSYS